MISLLFGDDSMNRNNLSSFFSSPWVLLLIGFVLGSQSPIEQNIGSNCDYDGVSHETITSILYAILNSWQSLVNKFLVPVYGLCIFFYVSSLMHEKLVSRLGRISNSIKIRNKQQKQDAISTTSRQLVKEDSALSPEEGSTEQVGNDGECPINMSGTYKLLKNDNFDGFLAAQGVPWALRSAANQARPIHKITHRGKMITIRIQGIIESESTYIIDGPPVETNIRGRIFQDRMTYLDTRDGIQVSKIALTEDYDIVTTRQLSEDRNTITMISRAIFKDGRDPAQSVQVFERIA